ncbi:MAG TPA: HIT domain-containing protein [Acidobacteriota bacterium]|nr:HIT domain-containing protein [Acidobacteriota bacterium]
MDLLWTPWRYRYVSSRSPVECIFCELLGRPREEDARNLILSRRSHIYLILNRYPYTSGHMMVVLNRHVSDLEHSDPAELKELIDAAREVEGVLRRTYAPDGFNIGFNIGKSAGAGVAGHLHLHIVPRWIGDSNFVSVIGETRMIPEDLSSAFDRLAPHFQD